jgi:hypothetical protein
VLNRGIYIDYTTTSYRVGDRTFFRKNCRYLHLNGTDEVSVAGSTHNLPLKPSQIPAPRSKIQSKTYRLPPVLHSFDVLYAWGMRSRRCPYVIMNRGEPHAPFHRISRPSCLGSSLCLWHSKKGYKLGRPVPNPWSGFPHGLRSTARIKTEPSP